MSQTKAQLVGGVGISTAENLVVTGVTTLGNVKVGVGTTALIVEGDARITGILTIGTSSITLDGSTNAINIGTGVTITTTEIKVGGVTIGNTGITGSGSTVAAAAVAYGLQGTPNLNIGVTTTTSLTVSGNYKTGITSVSELNIDCSLGNYFIKTIAGISTFSFSNAPASSAYSFTLELMQTSGAVTWPTEVKWPGDTAPTLTEGKTHLFLFVTDNGGTRWRGASLVDYVN